MLSQALRRRILSGWPLLLLALAGCSFGGPQGAGDIAGRQALGSPTSGIPEATVLDIAERTRASGDTASAISFYRRAHAMAPNDVKPLIGLGGTLNQVGAPNEAAEVYREALSHAPDNAEAMRGLALALVALNQPAAAIAEFNKALARAPDARSFDGLGIAEDLAGDYAAAQAAYHKGLALAPNDLALRNNLGLSLALSGDYKAAIELLRSVATDAAAGPRHRLNLALALGLAGRMEEAAQVARIDLDERSVRGNLAYYAELRKLPPKARAQAILRPNGGIDAASTAAACPQSACGSAPTARSGTSQAGPDASNLAAEPVAPVDFQSLPPAPRASP